jgi:hypothetical protein
LFIKIQEDATWEKVTEALNGVKYGEAHMAILDPKRKKKRKKNKAFLWWY